METYAVLKVLHILGATVLFGTGIGTAFAMWRTHQDRNVQAIAVVSKNVVLADWLFTTPAVLAQPLTGFLLLGELAIPYDSPWVLWSLGLYVVTGLFWIPVVWLQIQVRDMAAHAAATDTALPPRYDRFMRVWFVCGWPAFAAVIAIIWLMVAKY